MRFLQKQNKTKKTTLARLLQQRTPHSRQHVNTNTYLYKSNCLCSGERKKPVCTYKSVLVRDVVGQLEFMESNRLGHPLLAGGRAVRVDIHPLGHLRVGLARHHPAGVVELVAAVVRRHDVHQQDVLGFFIEPVYSHFERREHPPVERKKTRRGSQHARDSTKTQKHTTSHDHRTGLTEGPRKEGGRKHAAVTRGNIVIV